MMRSEEAERFAAQVRALKERAGFSFEELAKRSGVSRSSLHRYCSGSKIPTGYGTVHAFAKACGASSEELRELHRLWALADATRSTPAASKKAADDGQAGKSPAPHPDTPVSRRLRKILGPAIVALIVLTTTIINAIIVRNATSRLDTPTSWKNRQRPSGRTAPVRVFNGDRKCRMHRERIPGCGLGLAINPWLHYGSDNVVSHRVWHGDVLAADCILYDGDEVRDETGATSARWFRVRLGDVPGGYAWLSGIFTCDDPPLPTCA